MKYLRQCRYFLRFGGISHSFSLFSIFFSVQYSHSYIHSPRVHSCFLIALRSVEGLPGVPSRDSNSACRTASRRTTIWAAPHPTPVLTTTFSSIRYSRSFAFHAFAWFWNSWKRISLNFEGLLLTVPWQNRCFPWYLRHMHTKNRHKPPASLTIILCLYYSEVSPDCLSIGLGGLHCMNSSHERA